MHSIQTTCPVPIAPVWITFFPMCCNIFVALSYASSSPPTINVKVPPLAAVTPGINMQTNIQLNWEFDQHYILHLITSFSHHWFKKLKRDKSSTLFKLVCESDRAHLQIFHTTFFVFSHHCWINNSKKGTLLVAKG